MFILLRLLGNMKLMILKWRKTAQNSVSSVIAATPRHTLRGGVAAERRIGGASVKIDLVGDGIRREKK